MSDGSPVPPRWHPASPPAAAAGEPALDRPTIRRLYWWSFTVRAAAGIVAYLLTIDADVPLIVDGLYYEDLGYSVASDWLNGQSSDWLGAAADNGRVAWLIVACIAVFYYLSQGIRAVPVLILFYSAVTATIPVYTYRIARELGAPESAARRAAWLVALSPAFVFWAGALYKEGLIFLALNAIAYEALRLQSRWRPRSLVVVVVSVFALLALRFYLAIMAAGVVAVSLLWGRRSEPAAPSSFPVLVRQLFIAVAFAGLMGALGFVERAERPVTETRQSVLAQIDTSRRDLATSAYSGYLPEAKVDTAAEALRFFPVGLLYFLTVPHPWDLGGIRQSLAIPETALWVLLYPLIVLGILRSIQVNRPGTFVLLAMTVGMCVIYALVSGNVGMAYRMRSQVWLLWAPFAAWGLEPVRGHRAVARGTPASARRLARVP